MEPLNNGDATETQGVGGTSDQLPSSWVEGFTASKPTLFASIPPQFIPQRPVAEIVTDAIQLSQLVNEKLAIPMDDRKEIFLDIFSTLESRERGW